MKLPNLSIQSVAVAATLVGCLAFSPALRAADPPQADERSPADGAEDVVVRREVLRLGHGVTPARCG